MDNKKDKKYPRGALKMKRAVEMHKLKRLFISVILPLIVILAILIVSLIKLGLISF